MKAASAADIKKELKEKSAPELIELCLRLSRFKKENKELLTFLLFEADDLPEYISNVKQEIDEGFAELNTGSIYFAKKGLRKILRSTNKYIRYAGDRQVEVELLLHYATSLKGSKIPFHKNTALNNLYLGLLKKTRATIATMHEDLQYDYLREVDRLE